MQRTPASDSRVDVESLKQENDHSINALSERIGLLKAVSCLQDASHDLYECRTVLQEHGRSPKVLLA